MKLWSTNIYNRKIIHNIKNDAFFAADCTLDAQCDSGYVCTSGSCGMYAYSLHLRSC
jgi:hypothetical protein